MKGTPAPWTQRGALSKVYIRPLPDVLDCVFYQNANVPFQHACFCFHQGKRRFSFRHCVHRDRLPSSSNSRRCHFLFVPILRATVIRSLPPKIRVAIADVSATRATPLFGPVLVSVPQRPRPFTIAVAMFTTTPVAAKVKVATRGARSPALIDTLFFATPAPATPATASTSTGNAVGCTDGANTCRGGRLAAVEIGGRGVAHVARRARRRRRRRRRGETSVASLVRHVR